MSDVVQSVVDNQIRDPKSSVGIYELPCGALEDGKLLTTVELREMSGREEDLLANPNIPGGKKIDSLLGACIERLGDVVDKGRIAGIVPRLPIGDRVFLLVAIRRVTLGDSMPFEDPCPKCEVVSQYTIDLSTLESKRMPDPMRREYEVALPSGRQARFRVGTGEDETALSKAPVGERPTALLHARTLSLEGHAPSKNEILNLPFRDRQALRNAFEDVDGGVDTTLELACNSCSHEYERELEMGNVGFFFPDRVRRNSKRRSST